MGRKATGELAGIKVVAAFPGGSPDMPASADRVARLHRSNSPRWASRSSIRSTPCCRRSTSCCLESVDGRPHLAQAAAGAQGQEAGVHRQAGGRLAGRCASRSSSWPQQLEVPCFSSSSLRFSPGILGDARRPEGRQGPGLRARGPVQLEPHHPDLFWYGIHGVETLFTIMGTGCVACLRVHTDGTDFVVGRWNDGRIGTFRGLRDGAHGYGATVFGNKGIAPSGGYDGYEPLVVEIVKFFKTGKPPVSAAETHRDLRLHGSRRRKQAARRSPGDDRKRDGQGAKPPQKIGRSAAAVAGGRRQRTSPASALVDSAADL